jgi:hypothetical protein
MATRTRTIKPHPKAANGHIRLPVLQSYVKQSCVAGFYFPFRPPNRGALSGAPRIRLSKRGGEQPLIRSVCVMGAAAGV